LNQCEKKTAGFCSAIDFVAVSGFLEGVRGVVEATENGLALEPPPFQQEYLLQVEARRTQPTTNRNHRPPRRSPFNLIFFLESGSETFIILILFMERASLPPPPLDY